MICYLIGSEALLHMVDLSVGIARGSIIVAVLSTVVYFANRDVHSLEVFNFCVIKL